MTGNGIAYETPEMTINLDPKRAGQDAINFVSHAHMDHLPSRNGGVILASGETRGIAELRGFRMKNHVEGMDGLEMTDSGHILGARGVLAGDVFYTGDICTRGRGFLPAADIPRCKTIITECTFGLPEFKFPSVEETKSQVNGIISDMYSRGKPVILMGYQLGKAQTISDMFGHWEPLIYHDSVKEMNDLHRSLGVPLRDAPGHTEAEASGLLDGGPWVMVAPMMSDKNPFIRHIKSKYGAVTVGFSGWAASQRFPFGRRCDHSVPLSDHCDFGELVRMVEESGAQNVYTVHGFVDEFAAFLRGRGLDARPLHKGDAHAIT